MSTISSSETFTKRRAIFLSIRKTVNYPRIFQVTGANQNMQKLDLAHTAWSKTHVLSVYNT